MLGRITPHLIEQARTVATLDREGLPTIEIAAALGVSKPRVSQIRAFIPSLRDYLGDPNPTDRLKNRRLQLHQLRGDALRLAAAIRRDLRLLDEGLEAAEIDRLAGIRPGERVPRQRPSVRTKQTPTRRSRE